MSELFCDHSSDSTNAAVDPACPICRALATPAPTPPDIDAILTERGNRYGKFTGHAMITQILKAALSGYWSTARDMMDANQDDARETRLALQEKWRHLAPDQREALEMIAHKIGRILNGDPNYADSWADIAGYAKLVADRLEGMVR